jgi:predicted RNA-binding Zn-ribbon protein involved in translation (DUF1610 family)
MPIHVTCNQCGHTLKAPDAAAGKKGKCPSCGAIVQIPLAPAPGEAVVEAEAIDDPGIIPMAPEPGDAPPTADGAPPGAPRRPCPMCGEMILAQALKCRYCGEILDPKLKAAEARKNKPSFIGGDTESLTVGDWVIAILCAGVGIIVGIIRWASGKPQGWKMLALSVASAIFWNILVFIISVASHVR